MSFNPETVSYLLGIDFGSARIGLAIGLEPIGLVRPLRVLQYKHAASEWIDTMRTLVQAWEVKKLILGLPLTLEGKTQGITQQVEYFAKQLERAFALPIHFQDERLTTRSAKSAIWNAIERGGQKNVLKSVGTDAVAAAIILQSYLEQRYGLSGSLGGFYGD